MQRIRNAKGGKFVIEVRHLTKKYGRHTAVDDLTFSIDKGKIYGFLGPNGAGKSTTMNMITGYLAATEGSIVIDGADILKEPEKAKKSVGYLPEIPPLYNEMTVREYLMLAAGLKGIRGDERSVQVDVIISRVNLKEVAERLIVNLSKGYRQRVGLAQAMIGFPETIILDEPMVGMDPGQIIEIRKLIKSLAKNHTVILSSHILAEVRELCDYILIISNGRLVAEDTPENLENLFDENDRIILEAKGSADDIRRVLGEIPGSGECRLVKREDGLFTVEVRPECEDDMDDMRERIFFAFAGKKIPVLSMMRKKSTLEEVYLKLTQGGGAGGGSHI